MREPMDDPESRIRRARLRKKIAAEVVVICRRLASSPRTSEWQDQTAAALELHDAHARHAGDLGDLEIAARAEERYDRTLNHRRRGR